MAAHLSAYDVSLRLNDGDYLFQQLNFTLDASLTALVGANGVGKSLLARALVGELNFTSGTVNKQGSVYYVRQSVREDEQLSIAQLFNLAEAYSAAQRVELGGTDEQDFVCAQDWWQQSAAVSEALRISGMPQPAEFNQLVTDFSGGEQFRLLWAAAVFAQPDMYIFDEPTNHLDQQGRERFMHWLASQQKPRLVISHDRDLLDAAEHILELTPQAVHRHSGGFQHYIDARNKRWQGQQSAVELSRKQQQRQAHEAQAALEKQQQRTARGKAKAQHTGMDKLLRDSLKQSAQNSQGQQKLMRQQRKQDSESQLLQTEQQREYLEPISLELPGSAIAASKQAVTFSNWVTGIQQANHKPITLSLQGAFRLRINGPNGVGKSVLLNSLIKQQGTLAGRAQVHVPAMYLAQHVHHFAADKTAIENLLIRQPKLNEQQGRERLARLRLRNKKADIAFAQLSGGEQLKAVLACELLGPVTPQLIILDEPTNHLDLDSTLALEQALSQYQGALIVVSHDERFVQTLGVTQQLTLPEASIQDIK
ncbi:ATP-binding cassette domain-containing protein [Reinekea thalattae]|uniref:ABC-F family ATP-binding cassette domain-containing protein n=1 Tax=Reinekea thalattae TaxID=2593301 RepID=A0A5C8Z7A5_9GAMM|nr:ATP-binding cassette domain-containing protein [Reinekea thalattae]TXR53832.1 ABC-F family ATP-binding cassette domain-containing protein [Reinekea thalattae]